jgi:hypothetical protein
VSLNTLAKRNSGLLDATGVLVPDGTIDAADRQTLVGDYLPTPQDAPDPPGPGAHNLATLGCGG